MFPIGLGGLTVYSLGEVSETSDCREERQRSMVMGLSLPSLFLLATAPADPCQAQKESSPHEARSVLSAA